MKAIRKLRNYFFRKIYSSDISNDFVLLFLKKEGKILLGKSFSNFLFLVGILFITFLAIGIAKGSLEYLERKMKDPFINWMSFDIPYAHESSYYEMTTQLNNDKQAQKTYKYSRVTPYCIFSLRFWDKDKKGSHFLKGRTIEIDDPLLKEIYQKAGNRKYGRTFNSEKEIGRASCR